MKNTTNIPDSSLVPAPTEEKATLTKRSPPLDERSTVSKPSYQYPTIILVAVPGNARIPDATKTSVEPTEVFKTIVSNITKDLLIIIAPISYDPETVLT